MHFQFWFKFSAFWLLACTFILNTLDDVQKMPGGGGGGLLGRVLGPFWSENGYRLCSFWPGIRYGFQGNYPECMNAFIVSIQNEQGRKRNKQIGNGFEEFFCLRSNLSNDDKRPGLKTGIQNDIFWSETASGFGEPGGTPPPRIPGSTPRKLQSIWNTSFFFKSYGSKV